MTEMESGRRSGSLWALWAVGGLALLWNGFGVVLWGGTALMPDAFLDGLPAAHRDYVSGLPLWSMAAWGLGVVGGTVGAVLLLTRRRAAVAAFALSLLGAAANMAVYLTNPPPPGFLNPALQIFIIGFALFLLWFAVRMKRLGAV